MSLHVPPDFAAPADKVRKAEGGIALSSLIEDPVWVAWRNEVREEGKPPTKVPYCAPDRKAEANDPTTWMPHDRAVRLADMIGGGIGIELGQQGEYWLAGVDFDTCRDPARGEIAPWAQAALERLDTYTEVSPSGFGVKAFLLINAADIAQLRALMGTQHGRQFKRANGAGAHPPAIELYVSHRYFAVTWQPLDGCPTNCAWCHWRICAGSSRRSARLFKASTPTAVMPAPTIRFLPD